MARRDNCFRQGINFQKCGAKNFDKTEIELDVGKCVQNQNKTHKTFVTSVIELYEFLTSLGSEVTNLIFPKDYVVLVSWKFSQVKLTAGNMLAWQLLST